MPKVSIGLPVFNGSRYLADAIESVLAQDFKDFELVISDNASTDDTAEICQRYAAADDRVRYRRNRRNLGAAPNYNLCFEESDGAYFKWLAHDDRIKPGFLSAAVAQLDADPDVVLVNAIVDYIDAEGRTIAVYDSELRRADNDDPASRFAAMVLRSHSCVDFFGLCRRSAMLGSLLHGPFHGADRAFLAQMGLRGRMVQRPEHLVEMREHDQRYTRVSQDLEARTRWHDAQSKGVRRSLPTLRLYGAYTAMVASERLGLRNRLSCIGSLLLWWLVNWNAVRVGVDVVAVVSPGIMGFAERLKKRWFGAAPGHFNDSPR